MYERYIKRLLDIILSLTATIILAIPMGLVALWIKIDSPGPVFFKQRRVGKGKSHFNILKFRTMRGDTPARCAHAPLAESRQLHYQKRCLPAQDQFG